MLPSFRTQRNVFPDTDYAELWIKKAASANVRVLCEFVQVVVHVDGVVFPQVDELLQGLVDEDDADERGEGLLCEAGDVTDQGAGICGH